MLLFAPTESGKRYIAFGLHIARDRGADDVVEVAEPWMHSILPMLILSIQSSSAVDPSSSETPTLDDETAQQMEAATRSDQARLRGQVRTSEEYYWAITRAFDKKRVDEFVRLRRFDEIPQGPQQSMDVAHIIPFLPNKFKDNGYSPAIAGAAHTWDML
ncbi:hypothetical protein QCA50_011246 [Cerrena zonata]|uniref:HNH nuclease domain-containing protein n=1 Tax=Cerrena zonata TaxID=2478898 RepID=A0AAW0G5V0_9APHY